MPDCVSGLRLPGYSSGSGPKKDRSGFNVIKFTLIFFLWTSDDLVIDYQPDHDPNSFKNRIRANSKFGFPQNNRIQQDPQL